MLELVIIHCQKEDGVKRHLQQSFTYIAAVTFIGGGNWSTKKKPLACQKEMQHLTVLQFTSNKTIDVETNVSPTLDGK